MLPNKVAFFLGHILTRLYLCGDIKRKKERKINILKAPIADLGGRLKLIASSDLVPEHTPGYWSLVDSWQCPSENNHYMFFSYRAKKDSTQRYLSTVHDTFWLYMPPTGNKKDIHFSCFSLRFSTVYSGNQIAVLVKSLMSIPFEWHFWRPKLGGFTSRSTARVIFGQALTNATCGRWADTLWLGAKLAYPLGRGGPRPSIDRKIWKHVACIKTL